jgi:hypothetical protein
VAASSDAGLDRGVARVVLAVGVAGVLVERGAHGDAPELIAGRDRVAALGLRAVSR